MRIWLLSGAVSGGDEIKPGRVYGHGPWIVKMFTTGRRIRDSLRPVAAVRCARHHARLQCVRTPRPIATLQVPDGRSLVVLQRIHGRTLDRIVAAGEPEPTEAFVRMMVAMHRSRTFHGDLHPDQLIWDGHDWYLLDLDGLRHPLRALFRRPVIERQWARLGRSIPVEHLERPFLRYLELAGWGWEPARAWQRVLRRRDALEREARATTGAVPSDPVACASTSASASRSLSA